jgi:hypothetical protein
MDRVITTASILVLALLIVEAMGVAAAATAPASAQQNKAAWVATQFVKSDETYKYDGIYSTLKVLPAQGTVSIMGFGALASSATAPTYTFKATFNCRNAGYGDRVGKILAQVITPHTALITVKNNKVISATLDGKWNMLTEKPI